ncbi:hypothetical protein CR513_42334, partial [Mucuna pruriens]
MANTKQVVFESRSLEAFMERKKTPPKARCSRELIQKSQLLKASFAIEARFTNLTVSKRLSPQGPDHKHH